MDMVMTRPKYMHSALWPLMVMTKPKKKHTDEGIRMSSTGQKMLLHARGIVHHVLVVLRHCLGRRLQARRGTCT